MADQKLTERNPLTSLDGLSQDQIHIVRNNQSYRMNTSLLQSGVIADGIVGNAVLNGGVIWTGTGLDYYVWADSYIINNVVYNIPISDTVTLSNGHATLERFDVFALDVGIVSVTGVSIVVVEGTPSATPLEPNLDLLTQVKVGLRLVSATETVDGTTTVDSIYDENIEWTNTTLPTGATLTDGTDPYNGTINFLTPATTLDSVSWTDSGLTTFNGENSLSFAFRTIIQDGSKLQIKLINSSSSAYWLKTLNDSDLQSFSGLSTDNWKLAQIKLLDFQASSKSATQYDRIEITFKGTAQFELDKIEIQGDLVQADHANSWLNLQDTDNSYVGKAGYLPTVNAKETGLELLVAPNGTPAGSNTEIQFNNSGVFGSSSEFYYVADTLFNGDATDYAQMHQTNVSVFGAGSVVTRLYKDRLEFQTAGGAITLLASATGVRNVTIPNVTGTLALELVGYTVATLPTGVVGDTAYVTDATTPTYLGTAVGGGAVTVKVFFDGTNWIT